MQITKGPVLAAILLSLSFGGDQTSDTQSAPTLITRCDFEAYVVDKDPKGLNVRSGPSNTFSILTALKDETTGIKVTGVNGSWLRISAADNVEGEPLFDGEGWVYGPLIGVSARSRTKLYDKSQTSSRVVGFIPADDGGTVIGCRDKWVQVQYKKTKGWMEPGSYCGNPVTTCP